MKHPLEYDSIPQRKIDQLSVILYVSLTKKFIGLREDKEARKVVRELGSGPVIEDPMITLLDMEK